MRIQFSAGMLIAVAACSSTPSTIDEATAFREQAENCLLDVRDRGVTYDDSANCQSLEGKSLACMEAGGQLPNESAEVALIAERGRIAAWQARAISASSDPTITLW